LTDRGYRTGGVDGRMGPQTQSAIRSFQKAEKLEPTGQLNRQTLVALGVQKEGDSQADSANAGERYAPATIRKVQQTLNARGFKAGPANGTLGESTRKALSAYQKSENLEPTGRLNDRTLAALGIDEDSAASGNTRRAEPRAQANEATIREVQRRLSSRGATPPGRPTASWAAPRALRS
jgi:peptidoglycan hydrolase-like protein with peptidoglycan-binding domain